MHPGVPCINCGGLANFTSSEVEAWAIREKTFWREHFPILDLTAYEATDEAGRDRMDAEFEERRREWALKVRRRDLLDPNPDDGQDDMDEFPCSHCGGLGYQTPAQAEQAYAERKRTLLRYG